MAIGEHIVRIKFRDTDPKSLGHGRIVPGSVSVAGLEPAAYELGHVAAGGDMVAGAPITAIRAIAPCGDDLFEVTFSYDDSPPDPEPMTSWTGPDLAAELASLRAEIDALKAQLAEPGR